MAAPASRAIRSLTATERRWLLSVVDAMLPAAEIDLSPTPREVPLERFLDDFACRAPLEVAIGVRFALWLVMLAPPFVLGRMRTFAGLEHDDRLAVLRRLAASDVYVVREMPLLLKMVACLGYCGVPQVQSRLGIPLGGSPPPEWLGAADAPHPSAGAQPEARRPVAAPRDVRAERP
jgi:hypothetical protein